MLSIVVGHYKAAALIENPEQVGGVKHRSEENRKRLRQAAEVFNELKNILAGHADASETMQGLVNEALAMLEDQTVRTFLQDILTPEMKKKIEIFMVWLSCAKTETIPDDFEGVIEKLILAIRDSLSNASRGGRPSKKVRRITLGVLREQWEEMTGIPATISTDRITDEISGKFFDFAYAVLDPVASEQDKEGLTTEIKEFIYSSRKKKKRKGFPTVR